MQARLGRQARPIFAHLDTKKGQGQDGRDQALCTAKPYFLRTAFAHAQVVRLGAEYAILGSIDAGEDGGPHVRPRGEVDLLSARRGLVHEWMSTVEE